MMATATKQARDNRSFTYQQWVDEGIALFGHDRMTWRFVCPSCGQVQTANDLQQFKEQGAKPDDVCFCCIGRFSGEGGEMCGDRQPCNYSTGGLFNISPVTIAMPDGNSQRAFDFDRTAG